MKALRRLCLRLGWRVFPRGPSLQNQALAWSLGCLLLVWLVFVLVGYATGDHEADELTDGHLASVAAIVLAKNVDGFRHAPDAAALLESAPPHESAPQQLHAHDYQQSMSAVVWDMHGHVRARIGAAPLPPFAVPDGFHTLLLGTPPRPWRVFAYADEETDGRKVAVLLDLQERDALAADIAWQVARPGLWLLPVMMLVLFFAVRRGLRPLHDLSAQVRRMDIHHPEQLQAPPQREFQSMVAAIHRLGARWAAAVRHERELADSFAHELRTPLASLTLHAGALRAANVPAAARQQALRHIAQDAQRASAVVRDLLALARASRAELAHSAQAFDLAELVRNTAADYAQAALESGHDISVHAPAALVLRGHPLLLEIALRNLLDNALAHTPAGTAVQVRLHAAGEFIEVCDNGQSIAQAQPGAAAPDAQNVGVGAGLGLGHQVVRRIAQLHGGALLEREAECGLRCYRITLGRSENSG